MGQQQQQTDLSCSLTLWHVEDIIPTISLLFVPISQAHDVEQAIWAQ